MAKNYLKSVGMLVGMIFGAGIFALPFAMFQVGIFWGAFYFFIAFLIMIFLHLWYGEVIHGVAGKHRFTAYVEMFLGGRFKKAAFLITIFSYFGALLVYGILGGIFLSNLLPVSSFVLSVLFFIFGNFLFLLSFRKMAGINLCLTIALLAIVILLLALSIPFIKLANFSAGNFNIFKSVSWFLPYGIWIFALAGFSALPEARDILSGSLRGFRRVILTSLFLCAAFYLIFIFTVVGASGVGVTQDSLKGLIDVLGRPALFAGSILGFLAVFTSYIVLAADLKNIFHYDFKLKLPVAWFITALPPIILFISGLVNIMWLLGIIGSIGLGLTGIFIILMFRRFKIKTGSFDSRFSIFSLIIGLLITLGIITSIVSELSFLF